MAGQETREGVGDQGTERVSGVSAVEALAMLPSEKAFEAEFSD